MVLAASSQLRLDANWVDYLLIAIYFGFVLGIGIVAKRAVSSSIDFFLSGRSLPAWVTGLAFISANLGAVEIIGMSANGAALRDPDRALLLDRRRPGDAVPRRGDDAVLLRLEGPVRPRVHEPAVRQAGAPGQRAELRARAAADRGHQPLPAGQHREDPAGLAAVGLAADRGRHRAHLHRARWPVRRHLQRGAPVLRDRRGPGAADVRRPAQGGWLRRPQGQDRRLLRRAPTG